MNYLITGVSKGLGLSTARLILEKGHVVFGLSRTQTSDLNKLMNNYPNSFFWKQIDLCNDLEELPKLIFKQFLNNKIPLHGLINNAAIAYDDIITNLNVAQLDNMFRVNVYAPMILTKYAIRNMLYNKIKGSIVQISSVSVHTGYKGLAMYAASKGALEAFSKNTAREWGERGIRSNALVAGFMETEMSQNLSDEQKDRIYKRTSLKIPTNVKSVSKTIIYLLEQDSTSITGQNIFVDSGTI